MKVNWTNFIVWTTLIILSAFISTAIISSLINWIL
jgi:hypothetical protein